MVGDGAVEKFRATCARPAGGGRRQPGIFAVCCPPGTNLRRLSVCQLRAAPVSSEGALAFTVRAGHSHTTTMGKQRMETNWDRMKDQILSTWGELDEKEMKKARGSLPQMVNLIHAETGEDRQLIMRKMSAFL